MRLSISRVVFAAFGFLILALAAYVLFVLSDPIDAFKNGGPFSGRVIDAETKEPIEGAFVLAGWQGTIFIHGGGCAGHTIERTDSEGRFYIPWQGMNIKWFLHPSITPGGLNVWAVDHRPWDIAEDMPPTDAMGTKATLPTGMPFIVKDVGTVSLTRKYWEDYGLEESRRSSSCAGARWFEDAQEYLAYRSKWNRVCGQATAAGPASSADLEYLNNWKKRLPLAPPKDDDSRRQYGNRSIEPAVVADWKAREADIDRVDLMIHVLHQTPLLLKNTEELAESERREACALLDVHLAGMQQ